MDLVRASFCDLPPSSLVQFVAPDGVGHGARLEILIRPGQQCAVEVIHENAQSITFGTVDGHPEAGRITFGAYRNAAGAVLFHIRSRARSTTAMKRMGFLAIGEAMQTNTWADFIRSVAALTHSSIDAIHADTTAVDERADDDEPLRLPTYLAVGD
jgi:hypothetical protein